MNQRDIETAPDDSATASADLPSMIGHFEIVGHLGSGGMGLVFEGRDPLLDRRVALKVLHPATAGGTVALARLLREAQALAKLSHPNVVTVYEVGLVGADPFIAMECVDGETLFEWMRTPRSWRGVLDMFLPIGHGLAAVHALGLVHRDVKPSNVLIDAHGVPKLGDFGLVCASEEVGGRSVSTASPDPALTATGAALGTPAYMSPEQHHGRSVDARADQYSYAKTLREALRAPFPATLEPILTRALADDPAKRFSSMKPLLEELGRVRRGHRRRWLIAGAAAAAGVAVIAGWGVGRATTTEDSCPRPAERINTVWSAARRESLQNHLQAIDPAQGRQRFAAARVVFDDGADRWQDIHVDACQRSHDGRQSDALLDREMACLDRALLEIDDTVQVVERATNPAMLDEAMRAVVGLPTLDACGDTASLAENIPLPADPLKRATIDSITRNSVEIEVALRTGGTRTGVIDRAVLEVARARTVAHPGTLALTLQNLAAAQSQNEEGDRVAATLREAITLAASAHDDRLVAELWVKLLTALAAQKQAREAAFLVGAAEAAVARTTGSVDVRASFLDSAALVATINADIPRAHRLLDEALQLLVGAGAAAPRSPLAQQLLKIRTRVAVTYGAGNDWAHLVTALRELVPLIDAQYGADHALMQQTQFNLGVANRHLHDDEAALIAFREAARIGEARLEPSPGLAALLDGVGTTLLDMGRIDEAFGYVERGVAMARATMPAGDPRLAEYVGALGFLRLEKGQFDEARKAFGEQLAIFERSGRHDVELGNVLFNLADVEHRSHHCEAAWSWIDRALATFRTLDEKDHASVDSTYVLLAECQLDTKQWSKAVASTDLVLNATGGDPTVRATARFARGRALAGMGRIADGKAEARVARAEMVKLAVPKKTLDEVDAWLAK